MEIKTKIYYTLKELQSIDETGEFTQITQEIERLVNGAIQNAKMSQFCEDMSRLDSQAEDKRVEMVKLWYNISLKIKRLAQKHYIDTGCDMSEKALEQVCGAIEFIRQQKKRRIGPRETTIENLLDWYEKSEKIANLKHKIELLMIRQGRRKSLHNIY